MTFILYPQAASKVLTVSEGPEMDAKNIKENPYNEL